MTKRAVVVTHVGRGRLRVLRGLHETQIARPDLNLIAIVQFVFFTRRAVDEDVIRAASDLTADKRAVDDEKLIVAKRDVRVVARGARIV